MNLLGKYIAQNTHKKYAFGLSNEVNNTTQKMKTSFFAQFKINNFKISPA